LNVEQQVHGLEMYIVEMIVAVVVVDVEHNFLGP
jgi:hypothetical protein